LEKPVINHCRSKKAPSPTRRDERRGDGAFLMGE
jgi:hypothetical protein